MFAVWGTPQPSPGMASSAPVSGGQGRVQGGPGSGPAFLGASPGMGVSWGKGVLSPSAAPLVQGEAGAAGSGQDSGLRRCRGWLRSLTWRELLTLAAVLLLLVGGIVSIPVRTHTAVYCFVNMSLSL